jgi:hypothetical protein
MCQKKLFIKMKFKLHSNDDVGAGFILIFILFFS